MTYACGRDGTNIYLEPSDFITCVRNRYSSLRPIYDPGLRARRALGSAPAATEPERLHIAGVITHEVGGETGAIRQVEVKDNSVKTSADYPDRLSTGGVRREQH